MKSNFLFKKYNSLFLIILSKIVNTPVSLETAKEIISKNNSFPLGFQQWFIKYGNNMLFKLSEEEIVF